MNSILHVVIALLLPIIVLSQTQTPSIGLIATLVPCGPNEEYTTCGSICAPTCADLRYPLPKPLKPCAFICLSGCFCKKGFYRSDGGKCVAPQQCCGKNERYQICGTACVETCNTKPTICTEQCVAGCFCGCSDYVRESDTTDSPCIHRDECSKGCAEDN